MKLVITTLALALVSTPVLAEAETSTTSVPVVERNIVSAEQKSQIKALVEGGSTRQEAREQVLSKEQLAKSPQRKPGGASGESILGQLGLNDEQKANINKIRAEGGTRKDVRGALTAEQAAKYDEMRRARKANKDKSHKDKGKKDKEGKKDKTYKARGE